MRRALMVFLVLMVGFFHSRLRRTAYANLRIAFGPAGPGLYLRFLLRFADSLCEVLKAARRNPARRPRLRFEDTLTSKISVPKPWVFVTGHLGVFELQSLWAEKFRTRLLVVVRTPKKWPTRKLVSFIRRRIGTEVLDKRNVVRGTIEAMSEGASVGIFADQNAGYHGDFVPFLGFLASTSRLPAMLALKFQKPIVMAFIRRDGPEHVTWIEKVIMPNPAADPEAEERRMLEEMNATFTEVIRRHPEEWFWFHRRWKTRPGDREAHILR